MTSKASIVKKIEEAIKTQEVMMDLNPSLAKEHAFAVAEIKAIHKYATEPIYPTPMWGEDKLRSLIEDVKIPVTVLSSELDISRTMIYRIVTGQALPSQGLTEKIFEFTQRTIKELER